MNTANQSRNEIDNQFKWKLEDIFPDDAAWESSFTILKNSLAPLTEFQGKVTKTAKSLLDFIIKMHRSEELLGRLYAYAHMKNDQDKSVAVYQEIYERCSSLLVEFNQSVSFFEPELLRLTSDELETFFSTEPKLEQYRHFLDNILRTREHLLSAEEERLLALAGEVVQAPAEIFGVWDSADIIFPEMKDEKGNPITISNGLYGKYQQSADRRLRRDSYMGLYKPFLEHRNVLAANYSAIIKSHIFQSRARKYESTLESALDSNAIPVTVYHKLINTTNNNLKPLHRYNRLRKEILKLDDGVHDYDLRAPLFTTGRKEYSWEQAKNLCVEGAAPLGEEYQNLLRKSYSEGWIDVYENKGKRTGAYSSGAYGVHPYVLMNYNQTLGDVFTLTHELGHALHTWYTINNQPFVYGDYPIFLAEVASTTNEALLQQHMIDKAADKTEKMSYLNAYLDKFSQTFYRQVLFAEFELQTHTLIEKGEALSADKLDELFGALYQNYHGPAFVLDHETKALWSRVPHFYYNYYVFQYSTSFTASFALAARILKEGKPAQEKYINFLKSGNSRYPIETLKIAGVDMSSEEPVLLALNYMNSLLDELERMI